MSEANILPVDAVGRISRVSEDMASTVFEANILLVDAVRRTSRASEDAASTVFEVNILSAVKVLEDNDALLDGAVNRNSRAGKVLGANAFPVDAVILGMTSRAVEDRASKVLEDKNAFLDGVVSGTSRAGVKKVLEENILLVVAVGRTCRTLV